MAYKNPKDPRSKEAKRRWYLRNKDKHKADRKKRQKRNRKLVQSLKRGKSCWDCDNIFPLCAMDFDHRKGEEKKFNLARVTTQSIETIKKEAGKCDIVCAVCHRIRTQKRNNRAL